MPAMPDIAAHAHTRLGTYNRGSFALLAAGDRVRVWSDEARRQVVWTVRSRWDWRSDIEAGYVVRVYALEADDGRKWHPTGSDLAHAGAVRLGDLAQGLDALVADLVDQGAEDRPAAV